MKKLFRKWLDNLMWKLRYVPMERIEGGMLIANKEKFQLAILQDQQVLSRKDVLQSGIPWETHRNCIEREMKRRIGEKIFNMGDLIYTHPDEGEHDLYTIRFRIWIAIRKK